MISPIEAENLTPRLREILDNAIVKGGVFRWPDELQFYIGFGASIAESECLSDLVKAELRFVEDGHRAMLAVLDKSCDDDVIASVARNELLRQARERMALRAGEAKKAKETKKQNAQRAEKARLQKQKDDNKRMKGIVRDWTGRALRWMDEEGCSPAFLDDWRTAQPVLDPDEVFPLEERQRRRYLEKVRREIARQS